MREEDRGKGETEIDRGGRKEGGGREREKERERERER